MAATGLITGLAALSALGLAGYGFWRYVWFFRNPRRTAPPGENLVSPADGTVVYAKVMEPGEPVIAIKQGLRASINDIVKEDLEQPRILIGVFMSPFNVHYNRAPLTGEVEFIRHHAPRTINRHMGPMHWRSLLKCRPLYRQSVHIVENERTVTKIRGDFRGEAVSAYVVQIAGKRVHGIDSYVKPGSQVAKGELFGMIRIGSQVDLVVTRVPGMAVMVRPGDKVRAGESVVIA
ncbi:MAG: phosphatidylserine decarboxylase [Desulfobaccales bacterium]